MSFLDRVLAANQRDMSRFRPFLVAGTRLGHVKRRFAAVLAGWPRVFSVSGSGVTLAPSLDDARTAASVRTAAVQDVLLRLRDAGDIEGWRDELYPVNRRWGEPPWLLMERAAIPYFGVRGYGVHLNGFVRDAGRFEMWVGRRARDKPTAPGKLDQLVAGGQPAHIGLEANLVKECAEEAAIDETLAARAVAVGAISYVLETPHGLRPDVIYNFDLRVPPDFVPENTDGEVEAFYLWSIEDVMRLVEETDEFKFNCALVVIDFLVRHGLISPEHPDYFDLLRGLVCGLPEAAASG